MQGRCRVDLGSMWSWMEIRYNKMRRGGKIIKLSENNKIVEAGIKKNEEVNVVKKDS